MAIPLLERKITDFSSVVEGPSDEISSDHLFTVRDGIRPLEAKVTLRDPLEDYPERKFLTDLYSMVTWIDRQLESGIEELAKNSPRVLSRKFSKEEVAGQQREYIGALAENTRSLVSEGSVVFAFPMHGAVPIFLEMIDRVFDRGVLVPVSIRGTIGASTGTAEVQESIDKKLLDADKIIVFADDILDSGVSVIQLALQRRQERLGGLDEYQDLIPTIQRLREEGKLFTDSELAGQYSRAASLLREEKIVLAPLYCKNEPFLTAVGLVAEAEIDQDYYNWSHVQADMLGAKVDIGETEWVMGGMGDWDSPLLDTGICGEKRIEDGIGLFDFIPEKHHEELKRLGLDRIDLRIGAGIRNLVVFNPDGADGAYADLVESVAGLIAAYMDNHSR